MTLYFINSEARDCAREWRVGESFDKLFEDFWVDEIYADRHELEFLISRGLVSPSKVCNHYTWTSPSDVSAIMAYFRPAGHRPGARSAPEYAQRRADETGKPYIVSTMGHALWGVAANRRMLREIGAVPFMTFYPRAVLS